MSRNVFNSNESSLSGDKFLFFFSLRNFEKRGGKKSEVLQSAFSFLLYTVEQK